MPIDVRYFDQKSPVRRENVRGQSFQLPDWIVEMFEHMRQRDQVRALGFRLKQAVERREHRQAARGGKGALRVPWLDADNLAAKAAA